MEDSAIKSRHLAKPCVEIEAEGGTGLYMPIDARRASSSRPSSAN